MSFSINPFSADPDSRFKLFHELMQWKVHDILLVSTPYDAWVLEEDCRLSERIIAEYRGLNLSKPPRLTWVQSAEEALAVLDNRKFDLVLTMSHLADMAPSDLGLKIKAKAPNLPVILLFHTMVVSETAAVVPEQMPGIDRTFVWSGDTDILVALIKSAEDLMNVEEDTSAAGIRIILFVQSSPYYLSFLLPILYREVVCQTQNVLEAGLNEEHRLLTMRARPKILIAGCYEEALELFGRFEPYVLGVISDVIIPRDGNLDSDAGYDLLSHVRNERFDIPFLMTGSEKNDRCKRQAERARFVDKTSPFLRGQVQVFFKEKLGFGDFIFMRPDGGKIGRAADLRSLVEGLKTLPDESFIYHSQRNDFSRWLFARTEIVLASKVRPVTHSDFPNVASHRKYLVEIIQNRYLQRQRGIVVDFDSAGTAFDSDFAKIGNGSLGGKARGLAFVSSLLNQNPQLNKSFEGTLIHTPRTLVITTSEFEAFINGNGLEQLAKSGLSDESIARRCLEADLSEELTQALRVFLTTETYPLAVRSSGLLEDAQHHAYAGLYQTYMVPNDHPDLEKRLNHLAQAVKLVYASTFFQNPRSYANRVGHRTEEEKMAVIIQQLVGTRVADCFYPSLSGVAQSRNYYPQSRMKPEDGVVAIAMGLGKMVVAGERSLRFCPKYPKFLPQRSTVDEILSYAQRHFYGLKMGRLTPLGLDDGATLVRREVNSAFDEPSVSRLSSTYVPEEHRIRDTIEIPGVRVLTFASVLKYGEFPLSGILQSILKLGQEGMGRPVEVEFSVNLPADKQKVAEFAILQMRPMTARASWAEVTIEKDDIKNAICYCERAMGNACQTIRDILYVNPATFKAAQTRQVARQVARLNANLENQGRKYILIGPGRWGSEDPWLGIPVQWADISGVGAVIETMSAELKAEPSQGSHFFHNLTALGISYLCVTDCKPDFFNWSWLTGQAVLQSHSYVTHTRLSEPLLLKVDGRCSCGLLRIKKNDDL
ncbi:MAG: hypothetical protein GY874_16395 [Desulfobacteraceae bacterium]|nr:hypothetical protein [Desulfobacteraceae bacterium]